MFKLPENSIVPISIEAEAPQSIMQVSTHPSPSPSPLKIPKSKGSSVQIPLPRTQLCQ